MTNKEIIAKIEAAGHQVPAGLNRAKLEALAAEKGVALEEKSPEDGSGAISSPGVKIPSTTTEVGAPGGDEDRNRLITPAMAVCGMTGNAEDAPVLPDAGEDEAAGDRSVPSP
jgi:hypothetical protein